MENKRTMKETALKMVALWFASSTVFEIPYLSWTYSLYDAFDHLGFDGHFSSASHVGGDYQGDQTAGRQQCAGAIVRYLGKRPQFGSNALLFWSNRFIQLRTDKSGNRRKGT